MDYAGDYDPETDFDRRYTEATLAVIAPLVRPGDRVLELGCATGQMTEVLADRGARVTAVDRSPDYLERARAKGIDADWVQAELDEWSPVGPYHHVVATNVLHEVVDPAEVLARVARVLAPGGMVHVTLQNPGSLHRQLALAMGLVADLREVSERGRRYGTRGLWTALEFMALARQASLTCLLRRGLMLKPLPNMAMAELPEAILEAMATVGVDLPDICAMNYFLLVAGRRGGDDR
jgi:trans-aconitate methyltransferase